MAFNMWFSTAFVVLLYVAVVSEEVQAKSSASQTLTYWHRKLPTTPIPDALQELIFPFSSHKTSELLDVKTKGCKDSTGETALTAKLDPKGHTIPLAYLYSLAVDDAAIRANPSLSSMFFLEEELHSGTKFTLYRKLITRSSPDSRIFFLPRRLAEAIPFSSYKLSLALDMLNISQGSQAAIAMQQTLQLCEAPAESGENKYCATSLESMIDYATSTLGTSSVSVLETNLPCNLNSQRYAITGIPFQSKTGIKPVACHRLRYPYAVYYCHQNHHTTAARVSLKGDDGSTGDVATVCHTDTNGWNPRTFALRVLNVKPGGAPICHFVSAEHVVWVPVN